MKKKLLAITAITAAVMLALVACNDQPKAAATVAIISKDSLIKRGEYLVNSIGCDDCHSPKKMGPNGPELDMEHRFAGHIASSSPGKADPSVMKSGWLLFSQDLTAMMGPWGISYSANISSDVTGIGSWTEAQFIKCLREGKLKGMDETRPLLPPMPWQNFGRMNDTDLKAIFAFLKTTKPVENVVSAPKPMSEL
jgi:cytochrome c2